jgi:transcriptional regulator with XRE-family HTH domain
MTDTGELFNKLRVAKGLSQDQVAEKIGWHRQEIQRIESGGDQIKVAALKSALKGMDATLAELYESKVPTRYSDEKHQELHNQLQEILEASGEENSRLQSAVEVTLNSFYSQLIEQQKAAVKKRGAAGGDGSGDAAQSPPPESKEDGAPTSGAS